MGFEFVVIFFSVFWYVVLYWLWYKWYKWLECEGLDFVVLEGWGIILIICWWDECVFLFNLVEGWVFFVMYMWLCFVMYMIVKKNV